MRIWIVLLLFLLTIRGAAQEVHFPLDDGWRFRQVGQEQWYPAQVPGVVQSDLLRNGLIPDFMHGTNIDSVQWVENEDWVYERTLVVTEAMLRHGHLELVFKGLDTFAEVYVNDTLLGRPDNMFRRWEWDVKRVLRKGENELRVVFRSPTKEGVKLRDAYGIQLPHDSDPSGVSPYIRKAAYQFGWDFCPRLVTSGIWQSVELRGWTGARIKGAKAALVKEGSAWVAECTIETTSPSAPKATLHVRLGRETWEGPLAKHGPTQVVRFPLDSADLWQPGVKGKARTIPLEIQLLSEGLRQSTWRQEVGFRTLAVERLPDASGSTFQFVVNGRPTFIEGCNVVPPGMLPGPGSNERWLDLVRAMKAAGMNMARLWAGGVYPPEEFLHACDTAGILVWNDLMFGGLGPFDTPAYLRTVEQEIKEQCQRLSTHPSLALVCGNNELAVAWKHWGWQQRYHLHGSDSLRVENVNNGFFQDRAADWVEQFGLAYLPSSPVSNWGNAQGLAEGDLHYWGVWHGDSTFSSFQNNVGRFVSEWGFQSYPDSALLAKYIHPDSLFLGSPAVARLQRSYKTDRPIWEAIERELGEKRPTTLGGFIEASQRAQAKAYGMAIEAHLAAQPHCMGTLLWQLNDCWPGPSWSIIDYEGNPKPAYEVVKRSYSTIR